MAYAGKVRIVRVLVVLLVMLGVATGGYVLHKHRKRGIVRQALAAGVAACEAGRWTEAADQLGSYLSADPRNIPILMRYADAQMRRRPQSKHSLQQASSALETILRIERGHPQASETLVQFYLAIHAPIEAERTARAWRQAHPQDIQARQLLAAALIAQQKLDEAIGLLEEIIAEQPYRIDAAGSLASLRLLHEKQDVQEARRVVDRVVNGLPDSAAARLARARFLVTARQYSQAQDDLQTVEKMEAVTPGDLLDLADLLADLGLYERADTQFGRVEQAAPDSPNLYQPWGQMLLEAGDLQAGATLADRALAAPLGEQRNDLLPLAAEAYALAGRTKDAHQCIEQLRTLNASSEMLLYLQGLALLAEGKTRDGVAAFQASVQRAPEFAQAHLALAHAQARDGNLPGATASLETAVRHADGLLPHAGLELARAYAAQGRWNDAARVAQEAHRHAPLSPQALLTSVEMQAMAARPGGERPDPSTIDRLYEQVRPSAANAPHDIHLQTLLAQLAAWRGQMEEAAGVLRALYEDPAGKPLAAAALSQIFAQAGKYDDAIRECQTAVDAAGAPQRLALRVRLVELHLAAGRAEAAVKLADAVAAESSSGLGWTGVVDVAESLAQAGYQDKARQLFSMVAAKDGQDLRSRLGLLSLAPKGASGPSRQELLEQVKQIEGSEGTNWRTWQARIWSEEEWPQCRFRLESLLRESRAKFPDVDEFSFLLAMVYDRTDDQEQALSLYEQIAKRRPSAAYAFERLAQVATDRGRALTLVDQGLAGSPQSLPLLLLKANLLAQENPGRAAVTAGEVQVQARRRLAQHPSDQDAAIALAKAAAIMDSPSAAIASLETFVQGRHGERAVHARLVLAEFCMAVGDFARADALIRRSGEITPSEPRVIEARIQWLARQDRWQAIAELARQYRQDHPQDVTIVQAAAQQLLQVAEPAAAEAAASLLQAAIGHAPDETQLVGQLGMAYCRLGRIVEARAQFERGLRDRPGHLGLLNNLAWIVCEHEHNPQAAERLVADALRADAGAADFASLLDTCGVIAYRLAAASGSNRQLEQSRDRLEACLRHPQAAASTTVSATFHLARSLASLDPGRSRQLLEGLLASSASKAMLSTGEQAEMAELLRQLGLQAQVAAPATEPATGR